MPHTNRQLDSRLYTFVNTFVVSGVLLGVFVGLSRQRVPTGVGQFLAYRTNIKNLLLGGIFLLVAVLSYRAFDSSPQAHGMPVASVFALLFPLTTAADAFTLRTVAVFLRTAIVACFCGRTVFSALTGRLTHSPRKPRELIVVGSGPRAAELYRQVCDGRTTTSAFKALWIRPFCPAEVERQLIGGLEERQAEIQSAIRTQVPPFSLKMTPDDFRLFVKRGIDIAEAILGL